MKKEGDYNIVPTLAVTVSQCYTTGNGGGKSQACPDENFYKALNAVHGESATAEMQLALSRSQSIDDLDNDVSKYSYSMWQRW